MPDPTDLSIDQMLALLPSGVQGAISAADLRGIVGSLHAARSLFLTKAITGHDADPNVGAPVILSGAVLGTWFREETAGKWWRKTETVWEERIPDVVAAGTSGLMTGADKTKLDGFLSDVPTPEIAWVDNSRTDTYVENGSRERPFKSIVSGIAAGNPYVFLIGRSSFEFLTAPIIITSAVQIRAFTPSTVGGLERHIITFVASDGFVVDASVLEMQDIAVLVLGAGAACVKLDNLNGICRLRLTDCIMRTFFGGQFGIKTVANGTGDMRIDCHGDDQESFYGLVDLEYAPGMSISSVNRFSGIQLFDGFKTNDEPAAHVNELSRCRLTPASISGGNAAQIIEAVYCSTGRTLLSTAPFDLLKAADFTGLHTANILPVS